MMLSPCGHYLHDKQCSCMDAACAMLACHVHESQYGYASGKDCHRLHELKYCRPQGKAG